MNKDDLKRNREKLKMSQSRIADELGLSERFWCYRESGEKPVERWLARAVRDLRDHPKRPKNSL